MSFFSDIFEGIGKIVKPTEGSFDVWDIFSSGGTNSFGIEDWIGPALQTGTALVQGLYAQDMDQYKIDQNLAFQREELAQQKELAQAQIQAQLDAAHIAAGAAKKAARTRAAADLLSQARNAQLGITNTAIQAAGGRPELIQAQARSTADAYRQTGNAAANAFNNLIQAVQRPLLRG